MHEDKSHLINAAMVGGLALGAFWIFKYLFIIFSPRLELLTVVSSFLSLANPFILLYFLRKYLALFPTNKISFGHGVQLGMMLFFFASIIEAFIVFLHITQIDPGYVGSVYANMSTSLRALNVNSELIKSIENQPLPSNFNYIFSNVILGDTFIGIILSLIVVPIANKIGANKFTIKLQNKNEQN